MLVNSGVGDTRVGLGETGALFGIAQPTMINTNHSERWKWGNGRTDDKIKRPIASGKKEESMWVSNIIFQHTTAEEKKRSGGKKRVVYVRISGFPTVKVYRLIRHSSDGYPGLVQQFNA